MREWLQRVLRPVNTTFLTLVGMFLILLFWMLSTPFSNLFRSSNGPLVDGNTTQPSPAQIAADASSPVPSQSSAPQPASPAYQPNSTPAIPPRESLDSRLAKAENESAARAAAKLLEDYKAVETEAKDYAERLAGLATNDTGKRIAADRPLLLMARAILDKPPFIDDEFSLLGEQIELYQKEIQEAIDDKVESPVSERVRQRLREFGKSLVDRKLALSKLVNSLEALTRNSAKFEPSDVTLAEALQKETDREATELLQTAEAERQRVFEEQKEVVKDAERKKQEAALALERTKAENERASLIRAGEVEKSKAKQREVQERLEAEFEQDMPKIRRLLGCLFDKGHMQPRGHNRWVPEREALPVSLAGMRAYGVMGETDQAYTALLHFFNDSRNDRKAKGPYPSYIGGALTNAHMEAVRPAFELIEKYCDLMVEKGLLSP